MTPAEYLWDRIKHEENLFATRANYFLVAETLLFAALATDYAAGREAFVAFCILGILLNVLFIAVTHYHRTLTWQKMKDDLTTIGKLAPPQNFAYHYANHIQEKKWWKRSFNIMGIAIPWILLAGWAWVLFGGFTFPRDPAGKRPAENRPAENRSVVVAEPAKPTPQKPGQGQQQPAYPPQRSARWEHIRVERSTEGWAQSQKLASEGWELVTADVAFYYLKRRQP